MKGILKNIYDHLARMGLKLDEFEEKANNIPDLSEFTEALRELQNKTDRI